MTSKSVVGHTTEQRRRLLEQKSRLMARLGFPERPQSHNDFYCVTLDLRLIDEALERMDSGTYGICVGCGVPIPAGRLRSVPWAQYCADCQGL